MFNPIFSIVGGFLIGEGLYSKNGAMIVSGVAIVAAVLISIIVA